MFIEGRKLVKSYGRGAAAVYALNDADIDIDKGEIAVILGPSGSGKSTFLNLLGALDRPTSGTLKAGDCRLDMMSDKELELYRKNTLGFVFQSYNLTPDLTARENIKMTAELTQDALDIDKLMAELGISECRNKFPKELSGGQQQRVAIARAMVKKPEILLCDELTGALDSKASRDVLERIQSMNDAYKTTIVVITHNEAIADMADRIIHIKDGKIISNVLNTDKKKAEEIEL